MRKAMVVIMVVLVVPLFVIGMLRMYNGAETFLPDTGEVIGAFAALPNFAQEVRWFVNLAATWSREFQESYNNITDIFTFFASVGNFFKMLGGYYLVWLSWITVPIQFVVYIFQYWLPMA